AHAADSGPDPFGGYSRCVLIELELEKRAPEKVVTRFSAPLDKPLLRAFVFQSRPGAPMSTKENEQAIPQLHRKAAFGKRKQRDRVAPRIQLSADKEAHRSRPPPQLVHDAESAQQCEGRVVLSTDKVVKALDRDAAKIEMSRHPARDVGRIDQVHIMAIAQSLISGRQTHGTATDYDNLGHAVSRLGSLRLDTLATMIVLFIGQRISIE